MHNDRKRQQYILGMPRREQYSYIWHKTNETIRLLHCNCIFSHFPISQNIALPLRGLPLALVYLLLFHTEKVAFTMSKQLEETENHLKITSSTKTSAEYKLNLLIYHLLSMKLVGMSSFVSFCLSCRIVGSAICAISFNRMCFHF